MGFIYDKLEVSTSQTQLLTLDPAQNEDDEILCHMQTVDLESLKRLEYHALSYVWGNDSRKHCIILNGNPLQVRENLYLALKRLRQESASTVIWVDAICINQSDTQERNHQVRQIQRIYNSASRVIVWLGEADEDIDEAMKVALDISKRGYNDGAHSEIMGLCGYVFPGLRKLFDKPWWGRIWVLQEVLVARQNPLALCGRMEVPFDVLWQIRPMLDHLDLLRFLTIPYAPRGNSYTEANHLSKLQRDSAHGNVGFLDLGTLLSCTWGRQATDPRDKIFALLGLLEADLAEKFVIDYNLPVSKVYQQATAFWLETWHESHRFPLKYAAYQPELPSWCIDFSAAWLKYENFIWSGIPRGKSCGLIYENSVTLDLDHNAVSISGFKIGSIRHVYQRGSSTYDERKEQGLEDFIDNVRSFTRAAFTAATERLGEDEACRIFALGEIWKIIEYAQEPFDPRKATESMRKLLTLRNDPPFIEKYVCQHDSLWKDISQPWSHLVQDIPAERLPNMEERIDKLATKVRNCTFITTDTNYFGKASGIVEQGDVVCLFKGSLYPAILRPSGPSFILVSWAWIPGVMDRELAQDLETGCEPFHLI